MSIIGWIVIIIIFIGYCGMKFQEGASRGSGYRQEKQNQQIIKELRRQNEELKKQNKQ